MASQIPPLSTAHCRKRVVAWIEDWAETHTLRKQHQYGAISFQLSEQRHLVLMPPEDETTVVVLFVQLDSSPPDDGFPERFVAWLREGGDDPMPDAVYAPHLNTLGYGIAIPLFDWSSIETQHLPMIDFTMGHLTELLRCYQAVSRLDLEGDEARTVRELFHAESCMRRESRDAFRIPTNVVLDAQ